MDSQTSIHIKKKLLDEYEEDDFSHFDDLCLLCIDQYYRAAQIAYEKYGDKYKHITKDSLEKTIKNCTTFDYLYDKLTSDILTYDDNHEELKKLILA